jgi:hypothetical protein
MAPFRLQDYKGPIIKHLCIPPVQIDLSYIWFYSKIDRVYYADINNLMSILGPYIQMSLNSNS